MRQAAVVAILCVLALAAPVFGSAVLVIEGAPIVELSAVFTYSGQDYVEILPVLHALGYKAFWNEHSCKLVFKNESSAGVLSTRSDFVAVGTRVFHLPAHPVYLDARLCVPVKFVTSDLRAVTGKTIALEKVQAKPAPPPLGLPYRPLFLKRIVIDPGHGGHDSGAKSPTGIKEKDIVLAVALRLARRLREDMGIEVIMTRSRDRFITLGNRARIANASGADLFFCIHANGAFNNTATGTETFFLSYEASDRKAAALAAAENASFQLEADNPFAGTDMDDLKKILWDMVRTEVLKDSERLAIAVQGRLATQLNLPSRGVKQAPFYVLMGSSIPAILVEIGFMTTSTEAYLLANPRYQEQIASALFEALLHYDTVRAAQMRE